MVDNRTSGYYGIGGAFNFKSGDISGTAAKTADDRQSPGMEYFQQGQEEQPQEENKNPHVDRSAQLNATLNSLAMSNIATILRKQKRSVLLNDNVAEDFSKEENIFKIKHTEDREQQD